MKFYLLYGEAEKLEISGQCQIGRRSGDLTFSDELMSGTHAKLITDGEKLYVTDLGSSNGTFVNKNKIPELVPFELNDGDEVEMGAQKFKILRQNYTVNLSLDEGTRVETEPHKEEGTRVEESPSPLSIVKEDTNAEIELAPEAPAIALVKEEEVSIKVDEAQIEAPQEVKSSEATHLEAPVRIEPEALPVEAAAQKSEHTHIEPSIEAAAPEAPVLSHEQTHVEAPITAPAAPTLQLVDKNIEEDKAIEQPRPISLENEAPKRAKISAAIKAARPSVENLESAPVEITNNNAVVTVAKDMHSLFGTKTLIIGSAVIIGLFAFLLTGKKSTERTIARAEVTQEVIPSSPEAAAPVMNAKLETESAPPETAPAAPIAPPEPGIATVAPEAPSVENSASSAPLESETKATETPIAQQVELSPQKPIAPVEAAKPVPKKVKKQVARKKTNPTSTNQNALVLKSTKKDPYAEALLLKKLADIRAESIRSKSARVKAALEVDAIDITTAHYKQFKNAILIKWKSGRRIASTTERNKLKKTLQGQLLALKNREKQVTNKVAAYVSGKISTPLR